MVVLGRPRAAHVAQELGVGRWIAAQPPHGRHLAPVWVVAAVGTTSGAHRPVGSRVDYLASYQTLPGAQFDERLLLQNWVDGLAQPDAETVTRLLDELDVRTVCVRTGTSDGLLPADVWDRVTRHGAFTCHQRP